MVAKVGMNQIHGRTDMDYAVKHYPGRADPIDYNCIRSGGKTNVLLV
jgi:hypothetical protein